MLVNRLGLSEEPGSRARTRYLGLRYENEIRHLYASRASTSRLFSTLWMGLAESLVQLRQRDIGPVVRMDWHPAARVLEPFVVKDREGRPQTLGTRHPKADDPGVRGLFRSLDRFPGRQVLEVTYPASERFFMHEVGLDLLTRDEGETVGNPPKLNFTTDSPDLTMPEGAREVRSHVLRIPSLDLMEGWVRLSLGGAAEVYRLCPAAGRVSMHDLAALGVAGYVPVGLDVSRIRPAEGGEKIHPFEAALHEVCFWYSNLLHNPLWFLDAETALGAAATMTGIDSSRLFATLVLKDDHNLGDETPSWLDRPSYQRLSPAERDIRLSLCWYLLDIPEGKRVTLGLELVCRFDDLLAALPKKRRTREISALRRDIARLQRYLGGNNLQMIA